MECCNGSLSGPLFYSTIPVNVPFLQGKDKRNTNNVTRTQ